MTPVQVIRSATRALQATTPEQVATLRKTVDALAAGAITREEAQQQAPTTDWATIFAGVGVAIGLLQLLCWFIEFYVGLQAQASDQTDHDELLAALNRNSAAVEKLIQERPEVQQEIRKAEALSRPPPSTLKPSSSPPHMHLNRHERRKQRALDRGGRK